MISSCHAACARQNRSVCWPTLSGPPAVIDHRTVRGGGGAREISVDLRQPGIRASVRRALKANTSAVMPIGQQHGRHHG